MAWGLEAVLALGFFSMGGVWGTIWFSRGGRSCVYWIGVLRVQAMQRNENLLTVFTTSWMLK